LPARRHRPSEQSNADVWSLLASLDRLARDHHLAILMVSHFRKKNGAAMFRTLGSLAFIAATRAAWTIVSDPADPRRRLFLPIKNNLSPETKGLAFTFEPSKSNGPSIIHWLPDPVEFTVDAIPIVRPPGRPDDEREYAKDWLKKLLADGPCRVLDILTEASVHGISGRTLRRALSDLGGKPVRQGRFPTSPWCWELPKTDGQNTGE
jgi:hypothetical protein